MCKRLCLPESVDLFAELFDEDAHLAMGWFEVDGQVVVLEAVAGRGTDRGYDEFLA